jgi:hypothetical protein
MFSVIVAKYLIRRVIAPFWNWRRRQRILRAARTFSG